MLRARAKPTSRRCSPQVRTPTLVLHAREDAVVPLSEGRLLATEIPGAQFVELDSRNHVLLEHEPAWARFQDAVLEFTGQRLGWSRRRRSRCCRRASAKRWRCWPMG